MAEVWALQIGLQHAVLLKIKKIEIEMNRKVVHDMILGNMKHTRPLAIFVKNCRLLLQSFEDYKVSKISRSQTKCIDILTK